MENVVDGCNGVSGRVLKDGFEVSDYRYINDNNSFRTKECFERAPVHKTTNKSEDYRPTNNVPAYEQFLELMVKGQLMNK